MAFTDIITFFLSVYLLSRGAIRGFMNSVLFPFSIIAATILSSIYFKITNDMLISAALGLIGPFLIFMLLKFILNLWLKATNSDIQRPVFLSRLAGAALTFIWGWVFIVFALILLAVVPPWGEALTAAHNDVPKSASYRYIAQPLQEIFFPAPQEDAAASPNGSSTKDDAKSLSEDPRFQKILQDPDIQKEINAHDIAKLMGNPKMMNLVQQIMSDPGTMKKVLALYKSQAAPQAQIPAQAAKNP